MLDPFCVPITEHGVGPIGAMVIRRIRVIIVPGGLAIIGYSLPAADPYAKQIIYELVTSYTVSFRRDNDYIPKGRIRLVDLRTTDRERAEFLKLKNASGSKP